MSQREGYHVPMVAKTLLILMAMLSLRAVSAVAGDINSCKYLVVAEFSSDPYGIAKELRAQASAKSFIVVSTVADVSQADSLKTCVMSGSWSREAAGGQLCGLSTRRAVRSLAKHLRGQLGWEYLEPSGQLSQRSTPNWDIPATTRMFTERESIENIQQGQRLQ
jgi:hypothetical protein